MRLRTRYSCRYGMPHDMRILGQNKKGKWEICQICSRHMYWKKGYKGRVDNTKYLEAHVRVYAQKFGATKQIFNRLYRRELCKIVI